jgi:hypothetical protein
MKAPDAGFACGIEVAGNSIANHLLLNGEDDFTQWPIVIH